MKKNFHKVFDCLFRTYEPTALSFIVVIPFYHKDQGYAFTSLRSKKGLNYVVAPEPNVVTKRMEYENECPRRFTNKAFPELTLL